MNKKIKKLINKPASAMLIVIFVLAGIFIIAFGTGYRVFFSIKTGDIQSQSLRANYAVLTGEERVRYEMDNFNFATSSCPGTNIFGTTTLDNQTYYNVDCLSTSSPFLMRVYGNFRNIQRFHDAYYAFFDCGNETVFYEGGPYDSDGVATTTGGYYRSVLIGQQCWLKDNLNVGTMLIGTSTSQMDNSTLEKFCYDDNEDNCDIYGGLYQWAEAMQYGDENPGAQGICPAGWHIPTDDEQHVLELGLTDSPNTCDPNRTGSDCANAGTKLKLGGVTGFDFLSSGYRSNVGAFAALVTSGNFWSSTIDTGSLAFRRNLDEGEVDVYRNSYGGSAGFSVRCLRD
jgi:uncharacterized protein (TIGR02145 family)